MNCYRLRKALVCAAILIADPVIAQPVRPGPEDGAALKSGAPGDEADREFDLGAEAHRVHDWSKALVHYRASWKLRETPFTAMNLGTVERKLEMWPEAATHLRYAIDADVKQYYRPDIRRELLERWKDVRSRVMEVQVTAAAGATILVDGAPVGTAPLPRPLYLAPGTYELRAQLNRQTSEQAVSGTAGDSRVVALDVATGSVTGGQSAPSSGASPSSSSRPLPRSGLSNDVDERRPWPSRARTAVLIGETAATLIALGAGTGFYIRANRLDKGAESLRDDPSSCFESHSDLCLELRDKTEKVRNASRASAGFWVAGGVLAAATAATWVLWRPGPARPQVAVSFDRGALLLSAGKRF